MGEQRTNFLKDLYNTFKDSDSAGKLGILSDVLSIMTFLFTITIGQLIAMKFVIESVTFVIISWYLVGLGVNLLLFYLVKIAYSDLLGGLKSKILRVALFIILSGLFLLLTTGIWAFLIEISS
ncbi:hypothetical protein V7148_11480 [Gottfriedia acidiceleris]|uniref:hypothetical protein n=1 Tax=Gottfriedia acidiceleris TaxID=371036 RepID=UPI002FFF25B3